MEKQNKTNWKQNETKLSRSERREERNRSEIEDEVRRQVYDFKRSTLVLSRITSTSAAWLYNGRIFFEEFLTAVNKYIPMKTIREIQIPLHAWIDGEVRPAR